MLINANDTIVSDLSNITALSHARTASAVSFTSATRPALPKSLATLV